MGMNFDVIFDDSGGTRDLTDYRSTDQRWDVPTFIDDHVLGAHSSYTSTQAGIRGPVNYAEAMFIDARAGDRPMAITDLEVASTSAFGARVEFTAPAGSASGGHASLYAIRYSSSPIASESDWLGAELFAQHYTPRLAGQSESLRINGLEPGATYHIAVRGVDGAGNLGVLGSSASFTTTAAQSEDDRGRVIPSPYGGRFVFENGDAFLPVGDHLGLSWAFTRTLYPGNIYNPQNGQLINFYNDTPEEGEAEAYFQLLQSRGINTMRIYLELLEPGQLNNPHWPEGGYWLEYPARTYNDEMRQFISNLVTLANDYGVYLILSPFDSFHFRDTFEELVPFASSNGGTLDDLDFFYSDPGTLQQAKDRIDVIAGWVQAMAHNDHVLGWESISEWDAFGWGRHPSGDGTPDRAPDLTLRAQWINALQEYMKQADPDRMVFSSTISRDPRGPVARAVFNSRSFDAYTTHLYTPANLEPINNPDSAKGVRAAEEQAFLTSYWMLRRTDSRPFIDGEWGMSREDWPDGIVSYRDGFQYEDDEDLFRTVLWAGIASGQAGTPLRIVTEELDPNAYILTDPDLPDVSLFSIDGNMRPLQQVMAAFFADTSLGFDWAHASLMPLTSLIRAEAQGRALKAWGSTDGRQGLAYVLHDTNQSSGTVSGATLTIDGLDRDSIFDIEVWSTDVGTTAPMRTISAVFSASGEITFNLPDFDRDLALKFKARDPNARFEKLVAIGVGSRLITFALGADSQPIAEVAGGAEGIDLAGPDSWTTVDLASAANFTGRVVDMTAYSTGPNTVHLALTDDRHHLWVITGNLAAGTWSAQDLTAYIDAPGITGDLTTYQPSWGAIHIAGLDARGHAINYWTVPGAQDWTFTNLKQLFDGPVMQGGLTGYVAAWDGLNLAGLNEAGEVVVYWWAPGLGGEWRTINMTTTFEGPTLVGQLDSYVTPWGGLNIAGLNANGRVVTYWWAPGLERWFTSDITGVSGASSMAAGVASSVTTDGFINLFAIDDEGELYMMRWNLTLDQWSASNATSAASGSDASLPLGAASGGQYMVVGTRTPTGLLALFEFQIGAETWTFEQINLPIIA